MSPRSLAGITFDTARAIPYAFGQFVLGPLWVRFAAAVVAVDERLAEFGGEDS